jgi:hypothetical protein
MLTVLTQMPAFISVNRSERLPTSAGVRFSVGFTSTALEGIIESGPGGRLLLVVGSPTFYGGSVAPARGCANSLKDSVYDAAINNWIARLSLSSMSSEP